MPAPSEPPSPPFVAPCTDSPPRSSGHIPPPSARGSDAFINFFDEVAIELPLYQSSAAASATAVAVANPMLRGRSVPQPERRTAPPPYSRMMALPPPSARGSEGSPNFFHEKAIELPLYRSSAAPSAPPVAVVNPLFRASTALPHGWEMRVDQSSGRKYYLDHSTQLVTWHRPGPSTVSATHAVVPPLWACASAHHVSFDRPRTLLLVCA